MKGLFEVLQSSSKKKIGARICLLASSRPSVVQTVFRNLRTPEDRLCGLVVRVPGYRTETYCDSCEVRTEFIYVM
jgi:hypothetical protein